MIRHTRLSLLSVLSLSLSSLTALVAEARRVASGGYCASNAPQLLLNATSLPLQDAAGVALAMPDLSSCPDLTDQRPLTHDI